jgi:hypothetical protein
MSSLRKPPNIFKGTERVYFAFVLFRSGITADHIVEGLVRNPPSLSDIETYSMIELFLHWWQQASCRTQGLR